MSPQNYFQSEQYKRDLAAVLSEDDGPEALGPRIVKLNKHIGAVFDSHFENWERNDFKPRLDSNMLDSMIEACDLLEEGVCEIHDDHILSACDFKSKDAEEQHSIMETFNDTGWLSSLRKQLYALKSYNSKGGAGRETQSAYKNCLVQTLSYIIDNTTIPITISDEKDERVNIDFLDRCTVLLYNVLKVFQVSEKRIGSKPPADIESDQYESWKANDGKFFRKIESLCKEILENKPPVSSEGG